MILILEPHGSLIELCNLQKIKKNISLENNNNKQQQTTTNNNKQQQ